MTGVRTKEKSGWKTQHRPMLGSPTALVAAGRPESRDAVAGILDGLGFAVARAGSVAEARRAAARHPGRLDLLVTGVTLPDGSGIGLARAVERVGFEPAILYLTASTRRDLVSAIVPDTDRALLVEPVDETQVADAVEKIFDLGAGPRLRRFA